MAVQVNGLVPPVGTATSTGVRTTQAVTQTENTSGGAAVSTTLSNAPTVQQAVDAYNAATGASLNPLEPWIAPGWGAGGPSDPFALFENWVGGQIGYVPNWGTNLNATSSIPLNVPLPAATASSGSSSATPVVASTPAPLVAIAPPPGTSTSGLTGSLSPGVGNTPTTGGLTTTSGTTTAGLPTTSPSGSTLNTILGFLSGLSNGAGSSGGSAGVAPAAGDEPGTDSPISALPALTPIGTPTTSTSAGSPEVVLGVVAAAAAGVGFWLYERHKKKTAAPPATPPARAA